MKIYSLAVLISSINALVASNQPAITLSEPDYKSPIGDPLKSPEAPPLVLFPGVQVITSAKPGPYPPAAKAAGIQGYVIVEVWIDAEGNPTKAVSLWGPSELHETAADYCLRCKYGPYNYQGKTSPVRFRWVIPMRLRGGGPVLPLPPTWQF